MLDESVLLFYIMQLEIAEQKTNPSVYFSGGGR